MLDPSALSAIVPLPPDWPTYAKSALLHAMAIAQHGMTHVRGWCADSSLERVRWRARAERAEAEVALLRKEIAIKDARLERIPPRERPFYPPTERLAILVLQAARCWSQKQVADTFLITPATVASWRRRLDEEGEDALVRTPVPVNKMPDFVTHLVQTLRGLCPGMGKVRIADLLARAALHLAASTVRRMIESAPMPAQEPTPTPSSASAGGARAQTENGVRGAASKKAPRTVTSKYPNHVWGIDLTAMPAAFGFWVPWMPYARLQAWPFCWWIALVVDHYSRRIVGFEVFRSPPSAKDVCAVLDAAVARAGRAPKYTVTDQGAQFREAYRAWCTRNGVTPRFGAIGRHGSIALVERVIRSLKSEGLRRILVPQTLDAMRVDVATYVRWYDEHRPHQSIGGATPDEIYYGRMPKNVMARIEPRARYPVASLCAAPVVAIRGQRACRLTLAVEPFEGEKHLPVVRIETIAA